MLKYHKIFSLAAGILFLAVVQQFSIPEPIFRFLLPAFSAYVAAVFFYNRWYLKQVQKYNIWVLIRPVLLLFSAFGIFLLIPSSGVRGIFLVASVLVIALFQYALGNFSENVIINETLLIAFGMFLSLTGASLYIPPFMDAYVNLVFIAAVFLSVFALARSFYEFVPQPSRVKLTASVVIGFFCTQFFWALSFLPFHYSVNAILLFNFFYFLLIMNYYYFFQTLSLKKFQFHLALAVLGSGLVLIATPWKILS